MEHKIEANNFPNPIFVCMKLFGYKKIKFGCIRMMLVDCYLLCCCAIV